MQTEFSPFPFHNHRGTSTETVICFLDICKALSSTVRPREAAPPAHAVHAVHAVDAVHAAHALSLTRVAKFRERHNREGLEGWWVRVCADGME